MIYDVTRYGVIPDSDRLQTAELQKVFDLCMENGGTVLIPPGRYITGGLRMWSDTELYLESGAALVGSDICEDYPVFDVPEGVELRTDMELISKYYNDRPWAAYRRAMISVYGGKNIRITGENGALIDGNDCADPMGEEGYRGPHGIFITNCENVTLQGYTISDCGNFMHQIDNCRNVVMRDVTCTGGSDGAHLHHCVGILIEDCVFHTGDDCIAGINMRNMTVRRCELNTSCDIFRVGGTHILVEDCRMWGPGIFPHRMTVVQNRGTQAVRDKSNTLPRECGRHNTNMVFVHFASMDYPDAEPYHDVVFRNCTVDGIDAFLFYHADVPPLEAGTHLTGLSLENVAFTGLVKASSVAASAEEALTVRMKRVSADGAPLFDGKDMNTHIVTE